VRPDVIMSAGGMNFAACMVHPLLPRETRLVLRESNTTSAFLADVARTKPLLARAYRATYRALYRRADAVVCQSEFMVDDLAGIGVPRARLRRVYNPVDIDRVRELARAAPPPPVPGGPRLIAVGRLHHQKGYDVLLDAVARLRSSARARSEATSSGRSRIYR
jgi:glycosyltransferase involved in cell wall biosynthesis